MDKNFIFLNKFLDTLSHSEIDVSILKNYLVNYFNNEYINDANFLKSIDISNIRFDDSIINNTFNYKEYIDFDIPIDSDVIIFLNDKLFSFEKNADAVVYSGLNSYDFSVFEQTDLFNDRFLFKNLNFFYILNLLFYRFFKYFCINRAFLRKKSLYILNFFDDNYSSTMIFPRSFFKFEAGCKINVFEGFFNLSNKVFVNSSTCFFLENESEVNYVFLRESKYSTLEAHSFYSKLFINSKLFYNNYVFNCDYFNSNNYIFLLDKFCNFNSRFGGFVKNKSSNNTVLKVFNLGSYSISRSKFKAVVSDFGVCSFFGFIDVDVDVLNVDAGLDCKSLLLGTNASVKMLPELSIKNNDVKCFHGATVGFLDDYVVSYIMSRCFSESECTSLLVNAFLIDLIDVNNAFLCSFIYSLFRKYYV